MPSPARISISSPSISCGIAPRSRDRNRADARAVHDEVLEDDAGRECSCSCASRCDRLEREHDVAERASPGSWSGKAAATPETKARWSACPCRDSDALRSCTAASSLSAMQASAERSYPQSADARASAAPAAFDQALHVLRWRPAIRVLSHVENEPERRLAAPHWYFGSRRCRAS